MKSKERELRKIIRRQILPLECSDYLGYRSISSNPDSTITIGNIGNKRRNVVSGDRNKRTSKDTSNKHQQSRKRQRKEMDDADVGSKSNKTTNNANEKKGINF